MSLGDIDKTRDHLVADLTDSFSREESSTTEDDNEWKAVYGRRYIWPAWSVHGGSAANDRLIEQSRRKLIAAIRGIRNIFCSVTAVRRVVCEAMRCEAKQSGGVHGGGREGGTAGEQRWRRGWSGSAFTILKKNPFRDRAVAE